MLSCVLFMKIFRRHYCPVSVAEIVSLLLAGLFLFQGHREVASDTVTHMRGALVCGAVCFCIGLTIGSVLCACPCVVFFCYFQFLLAMLYKYWGAIFMLFWLRVGYNNCVMIWGHL